MVNWRSDKLWQTISAIAAVMAVAVTVSIFFISQKGATKQLEAVVLSEATLLKDDLESARGTLKVTYKGKEIINVSIIQTRIRNSGSQPIRSEDIEKAVTLHIEGTEEIMSADIVASTPTDLPVTASVEGLVVELSKCLLNPDDQFIVEVSSVKALGMAPKVKLVTGRIAGIKNIDFYPSLPSQNKEVAFLMGIIAAVVGTVTGFVVFALSYRLRMRLKIMKILSGVR